MGRQPFDIEYQQEYHKSAMDTTSEAALHNDITTTYTEDGSTCASKKHGRNETCAFALLVIHVFFNFILPFITLMYIGLARPTNSPTTDPTLSKRILARAFAVLYSAWTSGSILHIVVFLLPGIAAVRELMNRHIDVLWKFCLIGMILNAAAFMRCMPVHHVDTELLKD